MKAVVAKPATVWVIILAAILIAHPLIIPVTPGNAGIEETITIPVPRRTKASTASGLGRVALRLREAADQPRSSVQNSGVRRPSLKDGRELIVSYVGESRLVSRMHSGNARAQSLASADFDG